MGKRNKNYNDVPSGFSNSKGFFLAIALLALFMLIYITKQRKNESIALREKFSDVEIQQEIANSLSSPFIKLITEKNPSLQLSRIIVIPYGKSYSLFPLALSSKNSATRAFSDYNHNLHENKTLFLTLSVKMLDETNFKSPAAIVRNGVYDSPMKTLSLLGVSDNHIIDSESSNILQSALLVRNYLESINLFREDLDKSAESQVSRQREVRGRRNRNRQSLSPSDPCEIQVYANEIHATLWHEVLLWSFSLDPAIAVPDKVSVVVHSTSNWEVSWAGDGGGGGQEGGGHELFSSIVESEKVASETFAFAKSRIRSVLELRAFLLFGKSEVLDRL